MESTLIIGNRRRSTEFVYAEQIDTHSDLITLVAMGIFHTMPHTGVFPTVPDERVTPGNLQHYHAGWIYQTVDTPISFVTVNLGAILRTTMQAHADDSCHKQRASPTLCKWTQDVGNYKVHRRYSNEFRFTS